MRLKLKLGCGHEAEVILRGSVQAQAERRAWLEKHGRCADCWRTKVRQAEADGPRFYVVEDKEGNYKIAGWFATFKIKDELKKRQWRYKKAVPAPVNDSYRRLRMPPYSGWVFVADQSATDKEIAWLRSKGWHVVAVNDRTRAALPALQGDKRGLFGVR